jgi:hypothetical protein
MNQPFIKMLRYELKSNSMMWMFNLVIGVVLLTALYFMGNTHNSVYPIFIFPFFLFLTWVFTIYSYQESEKNQSMQMYHLVPVSRNTKFISKQFITLFAYPLALALLTTLFIGMFSIFVTMPDIFSESRSTSHGPNFINLTSLNLLIVWIFGHSISTFFAIFFKKNKIWYSILAYLGFRFVAGLILLTTFAIVGIKNTSTKIFSFTSNPTGYSIGLLILSVIFYCISYHLFFRRQL